jgi:endonuclease/exonuclease/phosphatase family metal-dependent hydrolase
MYKALIWIGVVCMAGALSGCGTGSDNYSFNTATRNANPSPKTDSYRVMSFNLRTKTFIDTLNHWDLRKDLVVKTINKFSPDLLGTQECQLSQARYLQSKLSGYRFVGAGRDNGKAGGEMCGLFFRAERFTKLDQGHFWLSNTPDKIGSKSWGSSYRRIVTWVKLKPRDGTRQPFYFFNTHLDNNADRARVQGAWLLRRKIDEIADGMPTIVTGDFNTDAGTTPYQLLVSGPEAWRGYLIDTYRQINPTPGSNEGTRHKFTGATGGGRIDWIITTNNFATLDANIDRTHFNGRYPSDHFPVTAVLKLRPGTPYAQHRNVTEDGS